MQLRMLFILVMLPNLSMFLFLCRKSIPKRWNASKMRTPSWPIRWSRSRPSSRVRPSRSTTSTTSWRKLKKNWSGGVLIINVLFINIVCFLIEVKWRYSYPVVIIIYLLPNSLIKETFSVSRKIELNFWFQHNQIQGLGNPKACPRCTNG